MTTLRVFFSMLMCVLAVVAFPKVPNGSPEQSWVLDETSEAKVKKMITESPTDEVEGIWSTTADGASVAIVPGEPPGMSRSNADCYLLVILRSPRVGIPAGTVMGWCMPSARSGYYDSYLFTRCDGRKLSNLKQFTLHLTDGAHLSMTMVRDGVELVAWKMIPYMFRSMLRERHNRASELDGMLRRWPSDLDNPLKPRYL